MAVPRIVGVSKYSGEEGCVKEQECENEYSSERTRFGLTSEIPARRR